MMFGEEGYTKQTLILFLVSCYLNTCWYPSLSIIDTSEDRDYKSYALPRKGQQVDIGEKGELIAKVDLRPLKLMTRLRRWRGDFPRIYIINYTSNPLG